MSLDFKTKEYLTNRNSLRYLITNPFDKPFSYTLQEYLSSLNIVIQNKKETCSHFTTELLLHLRKAQMYVDVKVFISKDHLISIKIRYNNLVEETQTRDVTTALQTIVAPFAK